MRKGDTGAVAALDRAVVVAQELGAPAELAGVRCSLACLALDEERLDEARREADEATALSALQHTMRRVSPTWVVAMVALSEGDIDAADQGSEPSSGSPRRVTSFATRPTVCGAWLG